MALSDEIRRERAKLKGKGLKAHWNYFWEYYKLPTAAVVVGIFFAISIIHSVLTARDTGFAAIFINASSMELVGGGDSPIRIIEEEFAEEAGLDTRKYAVDIDPTVYLTPGFPGSQTDYATIMKITTQISAKELDVIAADAYYFAYYARNMTLGDLRKVYSQEELDAFGDRVYYMDGAELEARMERLEEPEYMEPWPTTEEAEAFEYEGTFELPDPAQMKDPVPYGLIISDAKLLQDYHMYNGTVCILGVVDNSERYDIARSYVSYLLK